MEKDLKTHLKTRKQYNNIKMFYLHYDLEGIKASAHYSVAIWQRYCSRGGITQCVRQMMRFVLMFIVHQTYKGKNTARISDIITVNVCTPS
jgi:hypothetical protein